MANPCEPLLSTTPLAAGDFKLLWLKHVKTIINHPPVITIFIGGINHFQSWLVYGIVLTTLLAIPFGEGWSRERSWYVKVALSPKSVCTCCNILVCKQCLKRQQVMFHPKKPGLAAACHLRIMRIGTFAGWILEFCNSHSFPYVPSNFSLKSNLSRFLFCSIFRTPIAYRCLLELLPSLAKDRNLVCLLLSTKWGPLDS